ncbi:unnamed protein product [Pedinophyceae sp. YPF-701]|nr:unnamed protein product [Pedinophyceae sp. YPF-701]
MSEELQRHNLTLEHFATLSAGERKFTITLGAALADPESHLANRVMMAVREREASCTASQLKPCIELDLPDTDPDAFQWIVHFLCAASIAETAPLPSGPAAELVMLEAKRWRFQALVEVLRTTKQGAAIVPRVPSATESPSWTKEKLQLLALKLSTGLVDREHMMRKALLASIAGEHVLLLGPPGTAKSLLARRLHLAFRAEAGAGGYFEKLLTKFSTPEELFGPMSIQKLQEP